VPNQAELFVVDPNGAELRMRRRTFMEKATSEMKKIKAVLMGNL
tara:strand:- start:423 stop:554 length:132 start_codon:yes stop_codon:yes gene_type:complete